MSTDSLPGWDVRHRLEVEPELFGDTADAWLSDVTGGDNQEVKQHNSDPVWATIGVRFVTRPGKSILLLVAAMRSCNIRSSADGFGGSFPTYGTH
jgi:hypothetical protein